MILYVYIYNYLSQLAQVVLTLQYKGNSRGSGAHSTRLSLLIPNMPKLTSESQIEVGHSTFYFRDIQNMRAQILKI